MPADRFVQQLNTQIGNEFAAHQQYVACAVYYDALTLPQLAGFFYAQAIEERNHAMMMVNYLVDQDAEVTIPGVAAPQTTFADIVAPVALALEQEKRVTAQINQLTRIAREEYDFASDQFMQWFIKEQVEEVATMSDLLTVVNRARNDVAMRNHGYARADLLYEAVGALSVHHTPPYPSTHNLGTCRMSERPDDGVVDRWGRAHDVPNLFVSDGSVMTTGAAANPTLTIVALAIRQAEHIADRLGKGEL